MNKLAWEGEELVELYSASSIQERVAALGATLTATYGTDPVVCIGVLKGAAIFCSDLIRCMQIPKLEVDFVRLSSYGTNSSSSGNVKIAASSLATTSKKHVLIVEDIVDTGKSMQTFMQQFVAKDALSVRLAVLIDKRERRSCEVKIDYSCFVCDSGFCVGYGLDYAERYRHLPAIYELKFLNN
ncbi:MAG: hypoxanthine phosphoribosyltransferase [Desulfovibrionaceae bacterium]|nr:hypoxanthine phosphoribosyltransferase [Desulfovibrionaceae bacterium]